MDEVIKCGFDLNKTSYKTLTYLLKAGGWRSVSDIGNAIALERSGVQKALKLLLEHGLIERKQKNILTGGYIYFYQSKPKEEIMEKLLDIIERWNSALKKEANEWTSGQINSISS